MPSLVTVFIDYQNVHMSGHELWCNELDALHLCLIDPLRLAERIVKQRAPGGVLHAVHVYRGRPDPRKDPRSAARSDKQASNWSADERVTVHRRVLWYPRDWGDAGCIDRPREKGIDVQLAIDMVRMALAKGYEVGILVSRDTDLMPALELVFDLPGVHTEVATWHGASRLRLKYRSLYCHLLTEADFTASRDTHDYT